MSIEDVRLFLEKSHKLLILCHSNADPDALGCAIAIRRSLDGKQAIISCDGISKPAKMMLEELGESIGPCPEGFSPDSILIVDTSSPELLGECKRYLDQNASICVIDHHSTTTFNAKAAYREARSSNCELVWDVIGHTDDIVSRKALLAGILADTGHLKFATRETLRTVYEILGEDIIFEEVFAMMKDDLDLSKKIALMKALQRMKVTRVGDFMIIKTKIGAYESFISKNLLAIGADVVVIVNEKKGERIIARAKRSALDRGVDLSKIMKEVGEAYGGDGGGHPPAAGMIGVENYKEATEEIMKRISGILRGH
ncbi:MAG: DHH family phosphoesterase [Candidatus Methanofastidiosa archaeon]|nr:DHH family phosphoesterase [Candidatus Methanofastidiosa archaeon]